MKNIKENIKEIDWKSRGFMGEFRKFIARGNVMDMAVGVIIGAAFKSIVDSLVNDILMPFVGIFIGQDTFASLVFTVGGAQIAFGNFIQAIVNSFGVAASAGVGVAEKVCVFIMLVPSAYMQSMSSFVAQNMGADNPIRAKKALKYGILTFFHGDLLSAIFSPDPEVVAASHSYLKAYAIDCMLTPFLFCFTGYYNGCEKTLFVMIQGIIGAFFVRIPVAYLMSRMAGATLFQIGLSTPASSVVQILLCLSMFLFLERRSAGQSHASLKGSADP